MKCKSCGKKLVLPIKVYLNLETYDVGGKKLVVSECCGAAYEVEMMVKYKTTPYKGAKTKDDWGHEIKK